MIKCALDWIGKTCTALIKHGLKLYGVTKHGLIKHEMIKRRQKAIFNWAAKGLAFFLGEGAAIHTQASIKPCRRPLRGIQFHIVTF